MFWKRHTQRYLLLWVHYAINIMIFIIRSATIMSNLCIHIAWHFSNNLFSHNTFISYYGPLKRIATMTDCTLNASSRFQKILLNRRCTSCRICPCYVFPYITGTRELVSLLNHLFYSDMPHPYPFQSSILSSISMSLVLL